MQTLSRCSLQQVLGSDPCLPGRSPVAPSQTGCGFGVSQCTGVSGTVGVTWLSMLSGHFPSKRLRWGSFFLTESPPILPCGWVLFGSTFLNEF